jgi:transcription elongation GreA/GreB family factor
MDPLSDWQELPMVSGEQDRLRIEAELLECQLAVAVESRNREFGAPADRDNPVPLGEIEPKQRRLAQLRAVLRRARVTEPGTQPLIGARLATRDAAGEMTEYWLVAPGDGAAYRNRVPADSPFGRLLLNARLGSEFALKVPGGARRVTLVEIAYQGGEHISSPSYDAADTPSRHDLDESSPALRAR